MRLQASLGVWKGTKLDLRHNHAPQVEIIFKHQNRVRSLSEDEKQFICCLIDVGIPPEDVLSCFRKKYPEAPIITSQDVSNLKTPRGGGSNDAYQLLQKLQQLQATDPLWFVRFRVDDISKKLTHLFWMSPRQRDLARDIYQMLIHDNTYKTNRFKLPAGLFSAPNR